MKKATKVQKKAAPKKKKPAASGSSVNKAVRKSARPAAKAKPASRPVRSAKPAKPAPKAVTAKSRDRHSPARPARQENAGKTAKPAKPAKDGKKRVLCEFCGQPIPALRLEALPETTTCVECSQTKPYSEAQIIGLNGEETDQNRLNVEDFEETDSDFASGYGNDQW